MYKVSEQITTHLHRENEWKSKNFFTYNYWLESNVYLFGHRGTMKIGGLRIDVDLESACGLVAGDDPKVTVVVVALVPETAVDQLVAADGQEPPMELWRWWANGSRRPNVYLWYGADTMRKKMGKWMSRWKEIEREI